MYGGRKQTLYFNVDSTDDLHIHCSHMQYEHFLESLERNFP